MCNSKLESEGDVMLTIKEIMDAWNKVYGEDMTTEYSGFISELEKILIKKKGAKK